MRSLSKHFLRGSTVVKVGQMTGSPCLPAYREMFGHFNGDEEQLWTQGAEQRSSDTHH